MMRLLWQRQSACSLVLLGLSWVGLGTASAAATLAADPQQPLARHAPESIPAHPSALPLPLNPYPATPKIEPKPTGYPVAATFRTWDWEHDHPDVPLSSDIDAPTQGQAMEDPSAPDPQGQEADHLLEDPELGIIRVHNPLEDPELGILRIRDQPLLPLPSPPDTIGFLTARFSVVNSDNVLLLVNDVGGLTGDMFYRPAVTLAVYPSFGPETALIGGLDVGFQRYGQQSDINYNDWRARVALRQGLSPRSYAQIGVSYQDLWRADGSGFRFFDNRAVAFSLGRQDPLSPRLTLDSFYQVQWNEAYARSQTASGIVATDFSRLSQTAGAYLGYTISPQWHTGLNYQLNLIDYSTQERYDTVQQLLGQVVYSITPQVRLSLFGGWSFGRSSDPRIRLNDALFGITLDATVPLF